MGPADLGDKGWVNAFQEGRFVGVLVGRSYVGGVAPFETEESLSKLAATIREIVAEID